MAEDPEWHAEQLNRWMNSVNTTRRLSHDLRSWESDRRRSVGRPNQARTRFNWERLPKWKRLPPPPELWEEYIVTSGNQVYFTQFPTQREVDAFLEWYHIHKRALNLHIWYDAHGNPLYIYANKPGTRPHAKTHSKRRVQDSVRHERIAPRRSRKNRR